MNTLKKIYQCIMNWWLSSKNSDQPDQNSPSTDAGEGDFHCPIKDAINPAQALLLSTAWLYFIDKNQAQVWQADFFQFLILVHDDLKKYPATSNLRKSLKEQYEPNDFPSMDQWHKVADQKIEENWLQPNYPYRFNDKGIGIGEKVMSRKWDNEFTAEVFNCFTEETVEILQIIANEYRELEEYQIGKLFDDRSSFYKQQGGCR